MRALLADSCQTILKLGEDLNKSAVNITNEEHVRRLHTVLAAVSSFDYAEISAIGETLRDEKALQYMMEISDKIKQAVNTDNVKSEQREIISQLNQTELNQKQQQMQAKGNAKAEANSKGDGSQQKTSEKKGILKGVFDIFGKKDSKAKSMILPQTEPAVRYDPVTKRYIIQGEEPEPQKVIPKPPPATNKKKSQEKKRPGSQIQEMTAPPAFKRKSNAKQKQKAVDGELKHSNSQTFLFRYEDYREATLAEFSKLQAIVGETELAKNKQVDDAIQNSKLEELNKLMSAYLKVRSTVDAKQNQLQAQICQSNKSTDNQGIYLNMIKELNFANESYGKLLHSCLDTQQCLAEKAQQWSFESQEVIKKFQKQMQLLKDSLQDAVSQAVNFKRQYQVGVEEAQVVKEQLQKKNEKVEQERADAQNAYRELESEYRIYQQQSMKALEGMSNHLDLLSEFDNVAQAETTLLSKIIQKRVQLSSHLQDPQPYSMIIKSVSEHSTIVLELSGILSSIVECHLAGMGTLNDNLRSLQGRYSSLKQQLGKLKANSANQMQNLNRSISHLKILVQSYKQSQKQGEESLALKEIECEKYRKKLIHSKQEEEFTKQLMEKIIKSNIDTQHQSMTSMQEDNEELLVHINDLNEDLRVKEQSLANLRDQEQRLLKDLQIAQERCREAEKRSKELAAENRDIRQEYQQKRVHDGLLHNQQKSELVTKMEYLQQKIGNYKQKIEELTIRQSDRIATLEKQAESQIVFLRRESNKANSQIEQLQTSLAESQLVIKKLEESLSRCRKQHQLERARLFAEGEKYCSENAGLIQLCEQLSSKLDQKLAEKDQIEELMARQNSQQYQQLTELSRQHQKQEQQFFELNKQHQQTQESLYELLQKYQSYHNEEMANRKETGNRFDYLSSSLLQANEDAGLLLGQIDAYGTLIEQMQLKITELAKIVEEKTKETDQMKELLAYQQSENNQAILTESAKSAKLEQTIKQLRNLLTAQEEQLKTNEQNYNSSLTQDLEALAGECQQLQADKGLLELENSQKNEVIKEQAAKLVTLLATVDALQTKVKIQDNELATDQYQQEFKKMKQMQSEFKERTMTLQRDVQALNAKNNELRSNNKQLASQLQAQKIAFQTMEEDLEEKLAGGAELLEALNSDCETLKGLNEALTEANNKQSLQLKHLGTELASFKQITRQREECSTNMKSTECQTVSSSYNGIQEQLRVALENIEEKHQQLAELSNRYESYKLLSTQRERQAKLAHEKAIQELNLNVKEISEVMYQQQTVIDGLKERINYLLATQEKEKANFVKEVAEIRSHGAKLQKKLAERERLMNDTMRMCENKIELLERDNASVGNLKAQLKKLQEAYKLLQEENVELLKEKTELLRINDTLNQSQLRLVEERNGKAALGTGKNDQPGKSEPASKTEPTAKLPPSQRAKQPAPSSGEGKGFLNSLTNLFLTPSEAQKIQR